MNIINSICVYTGGFLTVLMALFHARFYNLFGWKAEFEKIGQVNQKIFYTIHLALTLLFALIGIIIIIFAGEVSKCEGISLGLNLILTVLWLWRFVWQAIYFKSTKKRKKSALELILLLWFFILFTCFILPVIFTYF